MFHTGLTLSFYTCLDSVSHPHDVHVFSRHLLHREGCVGEGETLSYLSFARQAYITFLCVTVKSPSFYSALSISCVMPLMGLSAGLIATLTQEISSLCTS